MAVASVSMSSVWDRTAEFLSDNLAALLPIALVFIFVPASIEGSISGLAQDGTPLAMGVQVVALVLAIVALLGQLSVIALALDPSLGSNAWRTGLARLPMAVLVLLVFLFILMLLMLPIPLVLAGFGYDFAARIAGQTPEVPPAAIGIIALYCVVLLPVALWVTARLALVSPIIVGERAGFGALGRSIELTRGATLAIIGVILLYAVVSAVAVLAAQTVFGSVFVLIAGNDGGGMSIAGVLTSIIVATVQTGFTVAAAAFLAQLYRALAARQGALSPQ